MDMLQGQALKLRKLLWDWTTKSKMPQAHIQVVWAEAWAEDQAKFEELQRELRALKHKLRQQQWCEDVAPDRWEGNDNLAYLYEESWAGFDKARDLIPTHYLNAASTATSSGY